MSSSIIRIVSLAAFAAFASTVMQAAQQATFHLPVAVHWGRAVLQPGDYKMSMPAISLDQVAFRIANADRAIYALPAGTHPQKNSDSSFLKLVEVNGEYFVGEFSSGPDGKVFKFPVPKQALVPQMANGAPAAIPVAGS